MARVVLGSAGDRWIVDITAMRGDSIEADLALRDFTVDAMALPLDAWTHIPSAKPVPSESVIDPLGGRQDLEAGTIRMVSPQAFQDDPLRMLRAISLASKLDFAVEPYTRAAIRQRAPAIALVPAERTREVFCEILAADGTKAHLALLDELDCCAL